MNKFATYLSLACVVATPCHAELVNCNGTWTDRPCAELNKPQEAKKGKIIDPDKAKKESLLHDLRMLTIESKRDYDIRYDISVTEATCKNSSLAECDKTIKNAQKDLEELRIRAQLVKTKKEKNELIKESNKLRKERNEIEAKKPAVVIQQNTILVPPRRPPVWKDSNRNSSLPIDVKLPE